MSLNRRGRKVKGFLTALLGLAFFFGTCTAVVYFFYVLYRILVTVNAWPFG